MAKSTALAADPSRLSRFVTSMAYRIALVRPFACSFGKATRERGAIAVRPSSKENCVGIPLKIRHIAGARKAHES
jgi:hypothetical protein